MRAPRLPKLWLKALRTDANTIASVNFTTEAVSGQTANQVEHKNSAGSVIEKVNASGFRVPISAPTTAPAGYIGYAEVALTNAQIKALRATPITLVAAPGAGRVLEFLGAVLILDYGTNVLTESADNLAIRYTDGSGATVSTVEATGFIDAAADAIINSVPLKDIICVANAPLVLHNSGDGEFGGNAGADTLLRVKVAYRVHTTGL